MTATWSASEYLFLEVKYKIGVVTKVPNIKKENINNTKLMETVVNLDKFMENANYTINIRTVAITMEFRVVDEFAVQGFDLSEYDVTQYDQMVMDAIFTLMNDGSYIRFGPEAVARAMAGNLDKDKKITRGKIDAVVESVDKLRKVIIDIDATNEFRLRGKIKKDSSETKNYSSELLPIKITPKQRENKPMDYIYEMKAFPAMYQYAMAINQIISVPVEFFSVDGLNDTDENILIKRYLFKRIEVMKENRNGRQRPHIIYYELNLHSGEYDGMFVKLELVTGTLTRYRKHDIHTKVCKILTSLTLKDYITGYEVLYDHIDTREIRGVKILGVGNSGATKQTGKAKRQKGKTADDKTEKLPTI